MGYLLTGHPHVRGDYSPCGTRTPSASGHPHVRGDYCAREGLT